MKIDQINQIGYNITSNEIFKYFENNITSFFVYHNINKKHNIDEMVFHFYETDGYYDNDVFYNFLSKYPLTVYKENGFLYETDIVELRLNLHHEYDKHLSDSLIKKYCLQYGANTIMFDGEITNTSEVINNEKDFRTKNILNALALIVELAKRMKWVTIEPEYYSYKRDVINTVRDNIDKFTQILNDNNFNYSNKLINIQLDEIIHEYFYTPYSVLEKTSILDFMFSNTYLLYTNIQWHLKFEEDKSINIIKNGLEFLEILSIFKYN